MKRTAIKKISNKQRAKNARELPIKLEILERSENRCEFIDEDDVRCETMGTCLYPLEVHHLDHVKRCKGLELETAEDGKAYCIIHHLGAEGIKAKFSEPQFGRRK